MKYDPGDLQAAMERDPAIIDENDAINYHAGFIAVCMYRESHELWLRGRKEEARRIGFEAHERTGCDIHPGAEIGKRFFIDHATGVVIGETAIIGDDVTIYQGVTLGGVSSKKEKRHPTLGNRVVVGAGAIVLGNITVGDDVRIGAGSVVVKDVPPDCTVVGVPARVVSQHGIRVDMKDCLEHSEIPDAVGDELRKLGEEIRSLAKKVNSLAEENSKLKNEIERER